ncbi:MAG: tetratricopeptide repeat protein [Bacteroidota bacterium]
MSKAKKNKKTPKPRTNQASQAPLPKANSFWTNRSLHMILIMALAFVLYGNTLLHDYTQDDAIVIYDNMYTTQGIKGIPGILAYDTFKGFFKVEGKDKLVSGGRYRPLTLIFFALEWQLFAQPDLDENGIQKRDKQGNPLYKGAPMVGHFFNILFYGLTGIVLYLLLLVLFDASRSGTYAYLIALLTALLFIAHPIHTEAVANIKGRDEIMTLLGSLAALYLSVKAYREKTGPLAALAVFTLFFLALMAKENAITFLAIVPLAYFTFTKADAGTIWRQLMPFFGAAVVFLLIRNAVIGFSMGEAPNELMNNPFLKLEGNRYVPLDTGEKLATIMYTLGKYVQLLILPHPLTHDYYPRQIAIMTWGNWQVILSFLMYLGMGLYAIRAILKKDPVGFGIAFFLASLSIVSNIVFPVGTNMSERFLFMPSVGFCLIIAVLVARFAKSQLPNGNWQKLQLTMPILLAVGMVLLAFGAKTLTRNTAWKDNFTLFTTDIKTSTNSAKLHNAVGGELSTRSVNEKDEAKRQNMLREAIGHLEKALQIHPSYKDSYVLLGNCYNYLREYESSINAYQKALAMYPDDPNAFGNLAITYRDAGRYYGEDKGDLQGALKYLREAEKMRPDDYETLRLMGVAYGVSQNNVKAVEYFQKALKAKPNDADAMWNLGSAYYYLGDEAKSVEYRQRAEQAEPGIAARKAQGQQ